MNKVLMFVTIVVVSLCFGRISYAVPAAPIQKMLQQPDGTEFKARLWGDERMHGWETIEGYTIVKDKTTGYWYYAVTDEEGELKSSGNAVGLAEATPATQKHLRPHIPKGPHGLTVFPFRAGGRDDVVPSTGTANIPVILVNFTDTTPTYTAGDFDTLIFDPLATSTNSMRDYYEEISYGNFSISSGVSGVSDCSLPTWCAASNTHNYYGQNDASGGDMWPGDLVYDAVTAADATFDFSDYDADGDCYVDVVAIIHQGTGEETGGPSTDIWSHRWSLTSAQFYGYSNYGAITTNDSCPAGGNIIVDDYIIMPELYQSGVQSTIGVFAHEYGHSFGLPDLYDTDYSSEGIGDWSLMAAGAWNYTTTPGDSPAHMDAWCKYYLEWVAPTQVTGTLTNEPIQAASAFDDVYQMLSGTSTSGEYFLIENRQRTGFDAGLPGDGLLIWHIDAVDINQMDNDDECYPHSNSNCVSTHYHIALEQADNLWHLEKNQNRGNRGDPFPGSQSNTAFTDATSPDSNLYGGTASNVCVTDISSSQSTMTASLTTIGPAPPSNLSATAISASQIDLSWTDNSNNETGFKIRRKTIVSGTYSEVATVGADVTTYSDTGLTASTTYYYQVRAYNSGDCDSNEATATTQAPPPTGDDGGDGGGDGGGGGCFIATATYGSPMHPYVDALGEFRDRHLLNNSYGRAFVDFYYQHSPPIADVIRDSEFLKAVTRILLTPVVMFVVYPYVSMAVFIILLMSSIFTFRLIRRRQKY